VAKPSLNLQPSELALFRAAAQLYAAYLTLGRVPAGAEREWMARALDDALVLARMADEAVVSDDEMG